MKDKLYKNNHKGIYYRVRKTLISVALFLGAFTALSIPTYINYKNHNGVSAHKAHQEEVVKSIINNVDELLNIANK